MATSQGIEKRGPDQENTNKYLSFREIIVKIGPVYLEIICLHGLLKRKKLTQAKYIARSVNAAAHPV